MTISEKEAAVMRAVARLHLQRVKRMAEGQKVPAMTKDDVLAAVAEIKAAVDDPEHAHALEDELYAAVLGAIADGHPDAARLARIVLKTAELDFPRWCA